MTPPGPGAPNVGGTRASESWRTGEVALTSPYGLRLTPHTYLGAKYRRIATRRGPMKAYVPLQHTMLTAICHMGTSGTLYDDPESDYLTRLRPTRTTNRAIHQLEAMGCRVTLDNVS